MMALLPLTLGPLLALSALLHIFTQKSFDAEVARRAKPEMAALSKNLDTLERSLLRQSRGLSTSDAFKFAAITGATVDLNQEVKAWIQPALFDSVKVYSRHGQLLDTYVRPEAKKLNSAWQKLFQITETKKKDGRNPAQQATPIAEDKKFGSSSERYKGQNLNSAFRSFIAGEGFWVLRHLDYEKVDRGQYLITVFRTSYDSDNKAIAYIESSVLMDSQKWEHMGLFQGVEFAIVDDRFNAVAASEEKFLSLVPEAIKDWTQLDRSSETVFPSKSVNFDEYPVDFFFAPLAKAGGETKAWIALGLSRENHVFVQNRILTWGIGITLLLSVVVLALAIMLSDKVTNPIQHLVDAAEDVKAGKSVGVLAANVEPTKEIAYLIERFTEMAMSVQAAKRTLEQKLEELAESNVQLTQMQDQLVQSAKMSSLGQLVAGVAHELNNPIAFIYSNMVQARQYLENMKQMDATIEELKVHLNEDERKKLEDTLAEIEWEFVQEDMSDIVQSCLEGSVRVKDIVLGLRNFSRIDKGQMIEADINQALQNTAKLLSGQTKNRVEVDWTLCGDAFVKCNISQVNQVFMNIMANAIQAIDGEGVLIVSTENILRNGSEFMKIKIQDNGQGMSPETIEKIFDPFFTTKSVGKGTGLGLSIVYGIIQKHGGFIDVSSTVFPDPMHGSIFEIYLPKSGPEVDIDLDQAS
ncbi:HAMP domain-containing histidine kinase [bacterium]|nr:HAMP domain-containing histidine kinase [bacterium]